MNPRENSIYFSSTKRPERLWSPSSLQFSDYQASFPGVKRPELEVDHCPPPSAEVKNEWSYTSACTVFLYGVEGEYLIILPLPLPLSLDFRINIFSCLDQFCRNSVSELPGCVHPSAVFLTYKRPDQYTHIRQYYKRIKIDTKTVMAITCCIARKLLNSYPCGV